MARILYLISQLEEGGAQRVLSNVISSSGKHESEVAALIASPPEKLLPFFRNPVNFPIHYLSNSLDFYAPGILPALRRLIDARKYDLVQCWLFESIIQGVIAARLAGIPCIASPRTMVSGLNWNRHKFWERQVIRKSIRKADLVMFPSSSAAVDYLHAGWVDVERIRIARNGVNCDFFQPGELGKAVVSVGRLSREKGFDFLGRVTDRLRTSLPDLQCIHAGGGEGSISSSIESAGSVEDIRQIYRRAALFLSVSWLEGLSVALLESQAMGIPAVARKIGGNSEVITHGVNGFLAETEDEFVEGCKTLLMDRSLCIAMGQNARARMLREFSFSAQAKQIDAICDELL